VLVWLILAAVPFFIATAFITRAYHAQERRFAHQWRARGERAFSAGDPVTAAEAFRNALTFARDDGELKLELARALRASRRGFEARTYLLALRDEQPGDGPVNLELGRLAVEDRDPTAAIRYYHDAIEGAWRHEPEQARRGARLELAEFLVRDRVTAAAQAELISLAGDLPGDPAFEERVATLMVDADMPSRGLPILRTVLSSRPSAAAAAGRAAFALDQDALAERYLTAARAQGDADASIGEMLEVLELSRAADPFLPRLPVRERIARAVRDLDAALARVDSCVSVPADSSNTLKHEIGRLRDELVRSRTVDPDLLQQTLQAVLRAETAAASCPQETSSDRALVRIAHRHQGAAQ